MERIDKSMENLSREFWRKETYDNHLEQENIICKIKISVGRFKGRLERIIYRISESNDKTNIQN